MPGTSKFRPTKPLRARTSRRIRWKWFMQIMVLFVILGQIFQRVPLAAAHLMRGGITRRPSRGSSDTTALVAVTPAERQLALIPSPERFAVPEAPRKNPKAQVAVEFKRAAPISPAYEEVERNLKPNAHSCFNAATGAYAFDIDYGQHFYLSKDPARITRANELFKMAIAFARSDRKAGEGSDDDLAIMLLQYADFLRAHDAGSLEAKKLYQEAIALHRRRSLESFWHGQKVDYYFKERSWPHRIVEQYFGLIKLTAWILNPAEAIALAKATVLRLPPTELNDPYFWCLIKELFHQTREQKELQVVSQYVKQFRHAPQAEEVRFLRLPEETVWREPPLNTQDEDFRNIILKLREAFDIFYAEYEEILQRINAGVETLETRKHGKNDEVIQVLRENIRFITRNPDIAHLPTMQQRLLDYYTTLANILEKHAPGATEEIAHYRKQAKKITAIYSRPSFLRTATNHINFMGGYVLRVLAVGMAAVVGGAGYLRIKNRRQQQAMKTMRQKFITELNKLSQPIQGAVWQEDASGFRLSLRGEIVSVAFSDGKTIMLTSGEVLQFVETIVMARSFPRELQWGPEELVTARQRFEYMFQAMRIFAELQAKVEFIQGIAWVFLSWNQTLSSPVFRLSFPVDDKALSARIEDRSFTLNSRELQGILGVNHQITHEGKYKTYFTPEVKAHIVKVCFLKSLMERLALPQSLIYWQDTYTSFTIHLTDTRNREHLEPTLVLIFISILKFISPKVNITYFQRYSDANQIIVENFNFPSEVSLRQAIDAIEKTLKDYQATKVVVEHLTLEQQEEELKAYLNEEPKPPKEAKKNRRPSSRKKEQGHGHDAVVVGADEPGVAPPPSLPPQDRAAAAVDDDKPGVAPPPPPPPQGPAAGSATAHPAVFYSREMRRKAILGTLEDYFDRVKISFVDTLNEELQLDHYYPFNFQLLFRALAVLHGEEAPIFKKFGQQFQDKDFKLTRGMYESLMKWINAHQSALMNKSDPGLVSATQVLEAIEPQFRIVKPLPPHTPEARVARVQRLLNDLETLKESGEYKKFIQFHSAQDLEMDKIFRAPLDVLTHIFIRIGVEIRHLKFASQPIPEKLLANIGGQGESCADFCLKLVPQVASAQFDQPFAIASGELLACFNEMLFVPSPAPIHRLQG